MSLVNVDSFENITFLIVDFPFLVVISTNQRPGDALTIPAFWFHHVENGRAPRGDDAEEHSQPDDCEDVPSVSVNGFSLCEPMVIAQRIFQGASLRPTPLAGTGGGADGAAASSVLRVLGTALVRGLELADDGKEEEFVRRHLLEARYVPLLGNASADAVDRDDERGARRPLTSEQRLAANSRVKRILPDFQCLVEEGGEEGDGEGIVLLVALHLLELWAVQLVGASAVARTWDKALS